MSLTVIISPMFSGKTSFLINKSYTLSKMNFRCLLINHSFDVREHSTMSCHNKLYNLSILENLVTNIKTDNLKDIEVMNYDYVFVDEFQFYKESDIKELLKWVKDYKKNVFVAGLKSDWKNEKFGHILDLITEADDVIVLKSLCSYCGNEGKHIDAPFTKRTTSNDKGTILIGAQESYLPVCRKHYN